MRLVRLAGPFLCTLGCATLFACASAPAEGVASGAGAIIAGTKTVDDHPSVGVLIDEFDQPHCTGTLIASNVVLTAAHCFDGPSKMTFQTGSFDAKKKTYEPLPSGDDVRPYAFVHSQYHGDSHDLAYVVLKDAVPDVTPAQIGSTDDATDSCGFEVVGYGRTKPGPNDSADDQPSDYQGERALANICITGTDDATGFLTAHGVGGSTCLGDSGGGLLERGASGDVLVATVRGTPPGGECAVGADLWFQPLATEMAFVQAALDAGKNPPSPAPAATTAPAPEATGDDDDNSSGN